MMQTGEVVNKGEPTWLARGGADPAARVRELLAHLEPGTPAAPERRLLLDLVSRGADAAGPALGFARGPAEGVPESVGYVLQLAADALWRAAEQAAGFHLAAWQQGRPPSPMSEACAAAWLLDVLARGAATLPAAVGGAVRTAAGALAEEGELLAALEAAEEGAADALDGDRLALLVLAARETLADFGHVPCTGEDVRRLGEAWGEAVVAGEERGREGGGDPATATFAALYALATTRAPWVRPLVRQRDAHASLWADEVCLRFATLGAAGEGTPPEPLAALAELVGYVCESADEWRAALPFHLERMGPPVPGEGR